METLEADPTELERYGDFLEQRGYRVLALRVYRAAETLRPPSAVLAAKIAALASRLSSDQGPVSKDAG